MKRITAILTALMLLIGMLAGCQSVEAESIVALEAVSAVQLKVVGKTVEDADSALDGIKLDKAIASVISDMIANGELTEENNTVLVTVSDAALQQTALENAVAAFEAQGFAGAVICQSATDAAQGKAALAQRMVAAFNKYSVEELTALDVNALNLLCAANDATLEGVSFQGAASEAAFVGEDTALDVAKAQAEVEEVENVEIFLDCSDFLFYDVKFTANGTALEAYIDAYTGALLYSGVVGGERTDDDDDDTVTEEMAIAAACISVGAEVSAVKDIECKYVDASAQIFYDVSFTFNGAKHNIMISATTGQLLEGDVATEEEDPFHESDMTVPNEETTPPTGDMGTDQDEAVGSDDNSDLGG